MASRQRFPNVGVRTQDGTPLRFYDDLVKGKVVLINFMFTRCTTVCPAGTANLCGVQQTLGVHAGCDVFLVSVTVDPEHDTPAVLKRYAERFHTRAGWTFVTGAAADIDLLRTRLGSGGSDDPSDHTGMMVYGNDRSGSWAMMPVMLRPAVIARSVLRLLP
jgi:protein SCO1/2